MNRSQKILTTALWGLLVLIMVGVIGAGLWKNDDRYTATGSIMIEPAAREGEVLFPVPAFSLVDQDNQTVTDQTLRGKPWVAAFIFTQCAGPCPMMSANMVKLQERVPNPNLRLVSFTVDPERDTPEVLKKYAQGLGADESRWSFVTGSAQAMHEVAAGMKIAAVPATETEPITHSTKFLLVDKDGGVRGIYASDAEGMEKLSTDATTLAGEAASAAGSSPSSPSPTTHP
ncbi:MAG: SCO family protein [Tepidisphaeraceae bacterium]